MIKECNKNSPLLSLKLKNKLDVEAQACILNTQEVETWGLSHI